MLICYGQVDAKHEILWLLCYWHCNFGSTDSFWLIGKFYKWGKWFGHSHCVCWPRARQGLCRGDAGGRMTKLLTLRGLGKQTELWGSPGIVLASRYFLVNTFNTLTWQLLVPAPDKMSKTRILKSFSRHNRGMISQTRARDTGAGPFRISSQKNSCLLNCFIAKSRTVYANASESDTYSQTMSHLRII